MITGWDAGDVALGPRSAECAGTGIVGLDGATLVVDPAEPGLLSRLTIFDPDLVTPMVDALLRTDDPAVDPSSLLLPPPRTDGSVRPTSELDSLLTYGVLRWLETWSPDELDPVLLDLELGCAAADADWLADSGEEAVRRLTAHLPDLLAWAGRVRDGSARDAHPAIVGLFRRSLVVAHDLWSESDPVFDELEHAYELATVLGGRALDWDDRTALSGVGETALFAEREPQRASHYGVARDGGRTTGVASVDWLQVPRGLLDRAERTVVWNIDKAAGSIYVEARASSGRAYAGVRDRAALAFRAIGPDGAVLGLGPLLHDPSARAFVGSARLDPQPELTVDVFDPRRIRRARVGPAAAAAAAERWSARAVSLSRLGLGSSEAVLSQRAQPLLAYAARLWEATAGQAPESWRESLNARQAQLLDQLHAIAPASSVDRRRAASTLNRLGREPRSFVPAVTLTATEWALLDGQALG